MNFKENQLIFFNYYTMIQKALVYIRDILNENFKNEFSISENKVVLSNIVNTEGAIAHNVDSKIIFFLINLDEEATLKNNLNRSVNHGNGSSAHKNRSLHLNLHLLFCANFSNNNYTEGLRYLSSLIRFFQVHNKLVPSTSGGINKLSFELSKLDYSELSHLWSAVGSKLMPSVLYKVGVLAFDDMPVSKILPVIKEPNKL